MNFFIPSNNIFIPDVLQNTDKSICVYLKGGGLQGFYGDGSLLSVFHLDHSKTEQPYQWWWRLQIYRHPRYLWVWEFRGKNDAGWFHINAGFMPLDIFNVTSHHCVIFPSLRWTGLSSSTLTMQMRSCRSISISTFSPWNNLSITSQSLLLLQPMMNTHAEHMSAHLLHIQHLTKTH